MEMINGVNPAGRLQPATAASPEGAGRQFGTDLFLQLLVTQLRYQDPFSGGQDSGELISQLTLFTLLEQVTRLQQAVERQGMIQEQQRALGLLNRNVAVINPGGNLVFGTVEAVDYRGAEPTITVNGNEYRLSSLVRVETKEAATGGEGAHTEGAAQ